MNFISIEECESNNGYGFGVTLFVSGCPHGCKGCFNKNTWDRTNGNEFTEDSYDYLVHCLRRPYIQRLTISGGDPLAPYNRHCVLEICRRVKTDFQNKINLWIYTGYTLEQIKQFKGADNGRGVKTDLQTDFSKTDFFAERGREFYITSAETENGFFSSLTDYVDFIIDGKFKENETHSLSYRGSDNQRMWHNYKGKWREVL